MRHSEKKRFSAIPGRGTQIGNSRLIVSLWLLAIVVCTVMAVILAIQHSEQQSLRAHRLITNQEPISSLGSLLHKKNLELDVQLLEAQRQLALPPSKRPRTGAEKVSNPAFVALSIKSRSLEIARRYNALFATLNLSPDRADYMRALLMKRDVDPPTVQFVMDEGDKASLRTEHSEKIEAEIQDFLTPSEFSRYTAFKQVMPAQNVLSQLQNMLASRGEPLDAMQSAKLIEQLLPSTPPYRRDMIIEEANWPNLDRAQVAISRVTLENAHHFLSPEQLNGLKELQTLQQAQVDLNAKIREVYRE